MSDEEKQRPSSLDEDMLKALEAAEAGLPSPLLDDGFLVDTDFLEDNSPLVRPETEAPLGVPTPIARPVPPVPRPRTTPTKRPITSEDSDHTQTTSVDTPTSGSAAPPVETEHADDANWLAKEAPLSQSLLNDLASEHPLDAETDSPTVDDRTELSDSDDTLSEEELAALIAQQKSERVAPEADSPLSQEDLDALISGISDEGDDQEHPDGPNSASDETPETNPKISQEDLDALIAGNDTDESPESETPAEDGPMSQEDLDALIAGTESAEATESPETPAEDGPMSQEDLDALIAGTETGETTPPEGESGTMSQGDLDALLATASEESDEQAAQLSDDELSGLFDETSGAPRAADGDAPLDETNLDAVLGEAGDEQPLDGSQLDAPVVPDEASSEVSLSQSSIDSLMADLDSSGALDGLPADPEGETSTEEEAEEEEIGDISQDMIDSLIASAQQEATDERSAAAKSEIGSENLAAAAASESGSESLSQSDLDKLIEASKNGDDAPPSEAPAPLQEDDGEGASPLPDSELGPERQTARGTRFRKQSPLLRFVQENTIRLAACITMGTLTALGTGGVLTLNREIRPDAGMDQALDSLEIALTRARDKMASGDYIGVVEELDGPIEAAYPGQLRSDALFVRLEAKFRSFRGDWGTPEFDQMTADIDDVLREVPAHPRIPEALYWKAKLFTADQPVVALEIYKNIFEQYADAPQRDRMLIEAAQLALEMNDPLTAAIYAQNLLSNYPASPWAGEAKLAIGDANVRAGNESDARTMFIRVAQSAPDSALAAKAFVRLGRLAYESGQYKNAEMHLKNQIETSTHLEGNDEVYLLLAQTYRASNQLEDARDTLSDLLTFFDDSPLRPRAFIEQSQVLEALGERERAIKTAQRATLEYPDNPDVLRNNGELQGLDGNPLAAAVAFVAADKAGAADPSLLLNAARYYRTANMPTEATRTYQRLKTHYAGTPEALSGSIEAAKLRYEQGGTEGALDDLKALLAATQGTRHQLPTLEAIQSIYRNLGLTDHIKTTAREIVAEATEPETLAQAAMDLMNSNDLENAQAAIEKLDFNRLRTRTAFSLLMKEGEALLSIAPQRGLEKMEQAYFNYPEARTRPADQMLLRTYLDTGRAAAARRMVMDLKAHVESAPIDTPYLVDASIAWGDFLYNKEDYRTAVFAFSIAEEATAGSNLPVTGLRSDPEWARYQRANALLQLADYEGCLSLYEAIAASDSPWAQEAAVKANLARLEQRQRGVPLAQNTPTG